MAFHRWSLMVLLALAPDAMAEMSRSPDPGGKGAKGFFVSVDGLNPAVLAPLVEAGALHQPHGLGWLYRQSLRVERAWPGEITLTAPSHVSTITCSPPSRHGVVANSFLVGGEKVSGFDAPFVSEPMWAPAARAGLKTLSLAYVGTEGTAPERKVDYAISYPESKLMSKAQTVQWSPADLPGATGWVLGRSLAAGAALKEALIKLVLNPVTAETLDVPVLIDLTDAEAPVYHFDLDRNLANGVLARLDTAAGKTAVARLIVRESDPTAAGRKRRTDVRPLPTVDGKLQLYVSAPSYNDAYPEAFRALLDARNLVWPDYGIRGADLSPAEYVAVQAEIDTFLTEAALAALATFPVDIVLFYQPLIDSMGHKYEARRPQPFVPTATDPMTVGYVAAFQTIDRNLSRLFAATTGRDVLAVMGDHGMDPIRKSVNVGRLLPPSHLESTLVQTSGSLTMLYPKPGTDPSLTEAAGAELKARLAALDLDGGPVLGAAWRREDFAGRDGDYHREWQFGEAVWAFASATGSWLVYDPLNPEVFFDPAALGMHGHPLSVATMATNILIKAPRVQPRLVAEASLMDAVPTFARLMGFEAPAHCVGQVLPGIR